MRRWTEVPVSERATDQTIMAAWSGKSPHYRDNERARLADPGPCIGAVKKPYGWLPCGGQVIPGADLCPQHGGPKRPRKIAAWVERAAAAWDEGHNATEDTPNPYRTGA